MAILLIVLPHVKVPVSCLESSSPRMTAGHIVFSFSASHLKSFVVVLLDQNELINKVIENKLVHCLESMNECARIYDEQTVSPVK